MYNENVKEKLPPDLERDMEAVARSVHDSWMRQRRGEGWTYGDIFDKEKMTTPNMTDYDLLPEAEKEVDRATVRQVIASLIQLGYHIGR